jgi:drug/metabolite transporter (DMT)-like permease
LKNKGSEEKFQIWLGVFFVFVSSISFSAKSVLAKLAYKEISDSVTVLMLRMVFSLPFFLIVAFSKKKRDYPLSLKDKFQILTLGVIGYYLASLFDFWGLEYIPAGMERVILFVYPTLVVFILAIIYKRKPEKREVLALVLTYGGILFIFIKEKIIFQPLLFLGSFFVFLSAFFYAIYLIGSEKLISKIGATHFTAYALSISGFCILIHFLLFREIKLLFTISLDTYILCFLMAVISTVIPTFLLTQGIKRIGSGKSAIVGSVGPVSTIVFAYFFLGEVIGISEILGTCLIILGVLIVSNTKKNKSHTLSKTP